MARGRGRLTPQEIEALGFFSSKFNDLLNETNTKQVELSKATGIPPSTLTGYVKGTSLPIPGNVQKIADYFGLMKSDIDPRFAPRKKNHELKIPTSPLVKKITTTVVELNVPRKQKVLDFATDQLKEQKNKMTSMEKKLYEYKVYEKLSAGTGYGYFGDGNYDTVFYEEELDYDFASWVFGDSMEPTYLNGEVVLIKQTGFDYEGGVYAVEWDGQTYIKKVYREKDGLRLVSLNKKYKDKFAPFSE
ncbi:TPA: helix-turn-helix transcriptional regulator, partial [Streptococcus equi subsp. equi]|nr:helix-turn-helix transcriptional regulator [Streptococcus equi subsp. equi]